MRQLFCFIIFCFAANISLQAQSKDEKEVAAAVEALRKVMLDGEKTQLEKIAAPQLSYGHSSGTIEDKSAFVEALVSGKNDFVTIDLTEQTIKVIGNTAIARHKLAAKTNNEGQPGTANIGVLLVWNKSQGQWKLLARQAFKL